MSSTYICKISVSYTLKKHTPMFLLTLRSFLNSFALFIKFYVCSPEYYLVSLEWISDARSGLRYEVMFFFFFDDRRFQKDKLCLKLRYDTKL